MVLINVYQYQVPYICEKCIFECIVVDLSIQQTVVYSNTYTNMSMARLLLRGTIVNRIYGIHKILYVSPFLRTIFGPINYGPR